MWKDCIQNTPSAVCVSKTLSNKANAANNGDCEMEFSLNDGGEDDEHTSDSFVDIF